MLSLLTLALPLVSSCASNGGGGDGHDPDAGPSDAKAADGPVSHIELRFDELPRDTVITNQYADRATFTSTAGIPITVENHIDIGQSAPNYLSAGSVSDVDHPLFVIFTHPARNLKMNALSVTDQGTVAQVRVFVGSQLAGTVDIIGKGRTFIPVPVDLSSFVNVTRIEVVNITDSYGIVYDDFSFDQ